MKREAANMPKRPKKLWMGSKRGAREGRRGRRRRARSSGREREDDSEGHNYHHGVQISATPLLIASLP